MRLALLALVTLPVLAQRSPAPSITLSGTVASGVDRGCFLVKPGPAKPTEARRVCYSQETVFNTSSKDLKRGQEVHVVGVEQKNGEIRARRIAVYNTDMPVSYAE